jgi:hypothetical protein
MRDIVSIRNIRAPAIRSASRLGKSEATADEPARLLLPLWPQQLNDRSIEGRGQLIAAIARALREERRRGYVGHGTYDIARHAALCRMLKQERMQLAGLETTEQTAGKHRAAARTHPSLRSPGKVGSAVAARSETHLLGKL